MKRAVEAIESVEPRALKRPMKPPEVVTLTPGKRVLFLTKDPELIRKQLAASSTCR